MAKRDAHSTKAKRVFISYRHVSPDQELALLLASVLEERGYTVFIDRKMRIGDKWAKEIEQQLRSATFFVVLLSKESILSDMVRQEAALAHQLSKEPDSVFRILPIRVAFKGALPYDLGAYLDGIQYGIWQPDEPMEGIADQLVQAMSRNEPLPQVVPDDEENAAALQVLYEATEKRGAPLPSADPRIVDLPPVEGGAEQPGSPFYIIRESDDELFEQVRGEGTTTVVRGARQMGKSSLLARAHLQAGENGDRSCYIDFQRMEEHILDTLDSLYRDLAFRIARTFRLKQSPAEIWADHLGPKDNLSDFVSSVLEETDKRIVLLLDEADRIFGYPYRDDFFALIRAWHNERALTQSWEQLNLVIAHSTEPALWIADLNQSPFNVGHKIELREFSSVDLNVLNRRHGGPLKSDDEIKRLWELVSGHPFLTRLAFHAMVTRKWRMSELEAAATGEQSPFMDHLHRFSWTLTQKPECRSALTQVAKHGRCDDEGLFMKLKAVGLIKGVDRMHASWRCRLYADYFKRHL